MRGIYLSQYTQYAIIFDIEYIVVHRMTGLHSSLMHFLVKKVYDGAFHHLSECLSRFGTESS